MQGTQMDEYHGKFLPYEWMNDGQQILLILQIALWILINIHDDSVVWINKHLDILYGYADTKCYTLRICSYA